MCIEGEGLRSFYCPVLFRCELRFYEYGGSVKACSFDLLRVLHLRQGMKTRARRTSSNKTGLHLRRSTVLPIRVRRGTTANAGSLCTSFFPNVERYQRRVRNSVVALRRRLYSTNYCSRITICLREQVNVRRVQVNSTVEVFLYLHVE